MWTVGLVAVVAFLLGGAFIAVGTHRGWVDRALWGTWWLEIAVVGWVAVPALAGDVAWRVVVLATGVVAGWELWRSVGIRPWAVWFPGAGLVALWGMEPMDALFLFGVVEIVDTGAFLVGRLGKTPLAPTISPRKTVEGAVAGVVCGAVAGAIAAPSLEMPIAAGPVLAVLTVPADLAQSWLKRRLGVVNFGAWLPKHGALLDVYDAFLIVAPIWWIWRAC